MTIQELLQERAKHVKDARDILDQAEKENRSLTAEENSHYESHMKECDGLADLVEKRRKQDALELELSQRANAEGREKAVPQDQTMKAFRSYLSGNPIGADERRALQMDIPTAGGYVVAPQQFQAELFKAVDDLTFVMQLARVIQCRNAETLGVPTLENDPADSNWTSEIATGSADSTMSFGKRELAPHPVAKLLKVSDKLIRASALDVDALVRERLAYKMAVTLEKAFMEGTGAQQPLGIFTASDNGISTGQDVSTGNTSTELRTDNLIEVKYKLKSQYWPRAKWIFNPEAIKQLRKLKDGEGRYIWENGIKADGTDVILGMPVYASEYAPHVFTSGKYVGILGDFSQYVIAVALDMRLQRLNELYAATNQVGFISRSEIDGMPVIETAFVRVTLG